MTTSATGPGRETGCRCLRRGVYCRRHCSLLVLLTPPVRRHASRVIHRQLRGREQRYDGIDAQVYANQERDAWDR